MTTRKTRNFAAPSRKPPRAAAMGLANLRDAPPANDTLPDGLEVTIQGDTPPPQLSKNGTLQTELPDGTLLIDFSGGQPKNPLKSMNFQDNLALSDDLPFAGVAEELIREIEDDIASRAEWMDMREHGLELLGLKIESPRADVGSSSAPLEGMSTVRAPTLLQACLKFQANARGEMLPAAGPVKVMDKSGAGSTEADSWADILETDMNVYLTQTLPGYYEDTDGMFFYAGFGGSGFKKVYHCPLRRMPVSDSVDASDLIVNGAAKDLRTARRVTHRITMRDSMVKRMQIARVYRDVPLGPASFMANTETDAEGRITGISANPTRPEDYDRTIYETLCERDFGEHPNGMPLPYKVTVDKDSMQVLEIRRNWNEDDPMYMPKSMYVRFPYVEAMGFYGIGLLHIVGNSTKAMTGAMREALDAGMFASFPGFLHSLDSNRQETNELRVPPGGSMGIKTSGQDIRNVVMPLPYKDVTPGLMSLMEMVLGQADKLSGAAEFPTGEGVQNAPVGTTLAIIDQSAKIMEAVHKRFHAAQSEEFRLLKERFLEDPEAFWRHNPNNTTNWDKETFVQALNMCDLVPVADPNTPTHTHRLMKGQALAQLVAINPQLYDVRHVNEVILRLIGYSSPDEFLLPIGTPQMPNPQVMVAQAKQQELQLKGQELQVKQQDAQVRAAGQMQDSKLELIKTQLQHQGDMAEIRAKAALENARLAHQRVKDGAAMASDALEHLTPPPMPKSAGAAGLGGLQ